MLYLVFGGCSGNAKSLLLPSHKKIIIPMFPKLLYIYIYIYIYIHTYIYLNP